MSIPMKSGVFPILLALIVGIGVVSGLTVYEYMIHSGGIITGTTPPPPPPTLGLKIYLDADLTIPLTFLEWGNIQAGGESLKAIWIENIGTSAGVINISTFEVLPSSLNESLFLSFGHQGYYLGPHSVIASWVKLYVTSDVEETVAFELLFAITLEEK